MSLHSNKAAVEAEPLVECQTEAVRFHTGENANVTGKVNRFVDGLTTALEIQFNNEWAQCFWCLPGVVLHIPAE